MYKIEIIIYKILSFLERNYRLTTVKYLKFYIFTAKLSVTLTALKLRALLAIVNNINFTNFMLIMVPEGKFKL